MPLIEVPDSATCHRCMAQPVTLIHRGSLYCGSNCVLHVDTLANIQELLKLAERGAAGSPSGRILFDLIDVALRRMRPTRDESCLYCWGGIVQDGTLRCAYCSRTREQALELWNEGSAERARSEEDKQC